MGTNPLAAYSETKEKGGGLIKHRTFVYDPRYSDR